MRLKSFALIVATAVCAALIAIAAYERGRSSVPPAPEQGYTYPQGRSHYTRQQAAHFGKADSVIIGDSLVEQTDFSGVCGRTFQAGLGGSSAVDAINALPAIVQHTDPKVVFIAIGTNYFTSGDQLADLENEYPYLIDAADGRQVVLVGIHNSDKGDAFIAALAKDAGYEFVAMPEGPLMMDKLHFTTEGSERFRQAIAEACPL
ncbi:SGNH/GDSL hydrolase family protein [Paraurantiacibacter namhicola]|uniref:SGNH hydrolase-type esterase domain-containing protein n=1 Tax=Paraurantiacibacter namhicola TaxID=645517 RepID=A0A1C7DBY5_9SPHN|nr:hypothetical protein [Paraurantiacibacter namhicola]ANU08821.1 hypothetical protein A6F65_02543 [Paraurantiacibacter namhicola]